MKAEVVRDPADFDRRTRSLLADEARHNRIRGLIGNIVRSPREFPEFRLYLVSSGDDALAAALLTPPFPLTLGDALDDASLQELMALISEDAAPVAAVNGLRPTVDSFVALWSRATGVTAKLQMANGVFALKKVTPARATSGAGRAAMPSDAALVEEWLREFSVEALPEEPRNEDEIRRSVTSRLGGATPGAYWLWEVSGRPVSLCGHGSPTGRGIRVGPVYTPPPHRRRGYAGALVAAESQWLLDQGYRMCFLYTDLANPTSNAIYERIGYRRVADAATYGFTPAGSG